MSDKVQIPDVQDVFVLTKEELAHWTIKATYDNRVSAYWGIFGLSLMPWERMPSGDGHAVCFMGGGEDGMIYAEAVLFMDGKYHHIRIEIARIGGTWRVLTPGKTANLFG